MSNIREGDIVRLTMVTEHTYMQVFRVRATIGNQACLELTHGDHPGAG